jgi:hypothetical protein
MTRSTYDLSVRTEVGRKSTTKCIFRFKPFCYYSELTTEVANILIIECDYLIPLLSKPVHPPPSVTNHLIIPIFTPS